MHEDRYANKWLVFATVACGSVMSQIDTTVVNLALPTLRQTFGIELAEVEWVVLIYLLVITSLVLVVGRLADLIGRTRLYNLGFVVFTVGSVLCGLSPNIGGLIAFRAVQAVGAAMITSSSAAILLDAFPLRQRGQVMGLNGGLFSVGAMIGPPIGGLLLTYVGWRAIFLVNVPVGILGMTMAFRVLPRQPGRKDVRFDGLGAVLVSVGVAALMLAVSVGQNEGWTPLVISLVVIAPVLLASFIGWQLVTTAPLLRLALLRTPGFPNALLTLMLMVVGVSSNVFLLPFFFVTIQTRSAAQAGVLLLTLSITGFIIQPLSGVIADRFEERYVASTACVLAVAGFWLLSRLSIGSTTLYVVLALVVMSAGQGLFWTPNSTAAYRYIPGAERGIAVGTFSFVRSFGLAAGTALAASVWTLRRTAAGQALGLPAASPQASVAGLHDTFLILGGLMLVALLASLIRPSRPDVPAPGAEAAVTVVPQS